MRALMKKSYVFSVLVLLKVILYYWMMDINFSTIWMIAFTSSTILLLYLGLNQSTFRKTVFLILYFAFSALMFGEVIYYRYFNTNLSIVIIQQAPKLYDVSDSVKGLVEFKEFLLLLDLPIVTYFIVNGQHSKMNHYRLVLPVVALLVLFIALNPFGWDAFTVLNHQELFTYHIADVLRTPEDVGLPKEYTVQIVEDEPVENPKLFGVFADRKVVVVQLESIQNLLVGLEYEGQQVMPYLTSLTKDEGIYFNSYYQQLGRGNTSDAEFVSNNSLYAAIHGVAYELYEQDFFQGLPWILREHGYSTAAYHGYLKSFWNRENAYPAQGFESFKGGEDYQQDDKIGMGLSDKSFFSQSVADIASAPTSSYHFLISLTSHNPYLMPDKSSDIVLTEEYKDTLVGNYLRSANYVDQAIELFITDIAKKDNINDYVFVFYGDHFGVNCKDEEVYPLVSKLIGESYEYNQMLNIPLIMYAPGSGISEEIERVGGQIDFQPTLLNLLGIKDDGIKYGQDIVNATKGFVASQTYMSRGSYITDDVIFEMARDGIFEHSIATDRSTGDTVPLELCFDDYLKALTEIQSSMQVLENDRLKKLNTALVLEEESRLMINDYLKNTNGHYYNQYIDDFSALRLNVAGEKLLENPEKHLYYIKVGSPALLNAWTLSEGIPHHQVVPVIANGNHIAEYRYYGYERPLFDISKIGTYSKITDILRQEALTGVVVSPHQYDDIKEIVYNVPIIVVGTEIDHSGAVKDMTKSFRCK